MNVGMVNYSEETCKQGEEGKWPGGEGGGKGVAGRGEQKGRAAMVVI